MTEAQTVQCNHTTQALDDSGQPLGSWRLDRRHGRDCVVCCACGRFYGYISKPTKKRRDGSPKGRDAIEAYREQQRRRSCPGCGEEPFLG